MGKIKPTLFKYGFTYLFTDKRIFFSVSSRAGGLFLFFLPLTATKNDKTPVNY